VRWHGCVCGVPVRRLPPAQEDALAAKVRKEVDALGALRRQQQQQLVACTMAPAGGQAGGGKASRVPGVNPKKASKGRKGKRA
jgi:hypothetical protein